MSRVTFIAPVNIAVIKYWGKRDETLILPLNDSLSVTISTDHMFAKTTVMTSPTFEKDRIWLNGREESFENNKRLQACLAEIKKRSGKKNAWKVHICSENNFPTAAGLASSAAGYACLVVSLAKAFGAEGGELSRIARQGSGSACRSLYGGFVRWHQGVEADGSDSFATQLFPATHWPSLRILILVVCDEKKKVGSTPGMKITTETSDLLKHRVAHVVPKRVEDMIKAIEVRDFEKFAELTMKDSNNMHAVVLDSYPPSTYMNDLSHKIVDFVHSYNKMSGYTKVAYTFDAGPNATLFLEEEHVPEVYALLKQVFPPANGSTYLKGLPISEHILEQDLEVGLGAEEAGRLKYIIHTKVGEGPVELTGDTHHLLGSSGLPDSSRGVSPRKINES